MNAVLLSVLALMAPSECLRYLDSATSGVEVAVRVFESKPSERAAKSVLTLARAARDDLERAPAPPGCAYPRSEELIYLNHLVPGFEGWLAARGRKPPVDYEIGSIIRRARTHRARGRERLR